MKLKEGVNVILVPTKEQAKKYGLGDDYLDVINNTMFGERPRHHIKVLDYDNSETSKLINEFCGDKNSILYTYFDHISELTDEKLNSKAKKTIERFILNNKNIMILFVQYSDDINSSIFTKITSKMFVTNNSKYYRYLTNFSSINLELLKNGKNKIKLFEYKVNNQVGGIIFQKSNNFSEIYPVNKYYCAVYILNEEKSSSISQFIQATTYEDAESIFIEYLTKYKEINIEDIKIQYIVRIDTDNLINRSKLIELIEYKKKYGDK